MNKSIHNRNAMNAAAKMDLPVWMETSCSLSSLQHYNNNSWNIPWHMQFSFAILNALEEKM